LWRFIPRHLNKIVLLQIDAEYVSKDGSLRLLVGHDPDGDIAIGFGGFQWHTHGDILASPSGLPVDQAVERYVGDILSNRALIAIARVGEGIQDIWVTDDPASCFEHKPTNEKLEFRTWDGTVVDIAKDEESG
jgi:hypothetical protein